jgi:hypothetical protein
MLGVVYAVLLAYVIVLVWEHYEEARKIATEEANRAASLYEVAAQYPAADKKKLQDGLKLYAHTVIDEEWALMSDGKESEKAWKTLDDLVETTSASPANNLREQAILSQGIQHVHELSDVRRERLLLSRHSVHPALWAALVVGGIVTVGFTYFFGLGRRAAQAGMIAAMTLIVAGGLFLVQVTDLPFSGDVSVRPDALASVLARWEAH